MLSIAQIIRNRISGSIPGDISKAFGTHEQVRFSFSLLSGLRMASTAGTHFYHANAWLGAWHTVATRWMFPEWVTACAQAGVREGSPIQRTAFLSLGKVQQLLTQSSSRPQWTTSARDAPSRCLCFGHPHTESLHRPVTSLTVKSLKWPISHTTVYPTDTHGAGKHSYSFRYINGSIF